MEQGYNTAIYVMLNFTDTYIYIYIYVCVCMYTHTHTHIYTYGKNVFKIGGGLNHR